MVLGRSLRTFIAVLALSMVNLSSMFQASAMQAAAKSNIGGTWQGTLYADICSGLQGFVFDRPVVHRNGLQGRYDGILHWTPDKTQFAVFNMKTVPEESPDAQAPIFVAMQQQDGLKLESQNTAVMS